MAALPACVPCHSLDQQAPLAGFEPATFSLTRRRARPDCSTEACLRTLAARRQRRSSPFATVAQEGFEPSASLVLSESGLPVAYRAISVHTHSDAQGGSRTHTHPGLSRVARPVGVPGRSRERKPWDSNPQAARAATWFQDRFLIRPVGFRKPIEAAISSGGWNRTSGLRVQSAASLPTATAPDSGRRARTSITWVKARQPTD